MGFRNNIYLLIKKDIYKECLIKHYKLSDQLVSYNLLNRKKTKQASSHLRKKTRIWSYKHDVICQHTAFRT